MYLLRQKKYDVVHAHYGLSGFPAMFRWKAPLVITLHGSDVLVGKIQPFISRFVCKFADGVIVVLKNIKAIIAGDVLPCGVDRDVFKPYPQMEVRLQLGLPLDKKLIIFPFNPDRKVKRFDLAKAVIEKLKRENYNIDLLVVHGVSNNKMPFYYSAADAMILCSDSEGSPTSVKEALSCNISVVSTDVRDVREILNSVSGTAVCNSNLNSLAENLKIVLMFRENNIFNGRTSIGRYDQHQLTLALVKIYERVINNHNN